MIFHSRGPSHVMIFNFPRTQTVCSKSLPNRSARLLKVVQIHTVWYFNKISIERYTNRDPNKLLNIQFRIKLNNCMDKKIDTIKQKEKVFWNREAKRTVHKVNVTCIRVCAMKKLTFPQFSRCGNYRGPAVTNLLTSKLKYAFSLAELACRRRPFLRE